MTPFLNTIHIFQKDSSKEIIANPLTFLVECILYPHPCFQLSALSPSLTLDGGVTAHNGNELYKFVRKRTTNSDTK